MSAEEKAENICRSIGLAMPEQKEEADMQKENRVGVLEAERRRTSAGGASKNTGKSEKQTVRKTAAGKAAPGRRTDVRRAESPTGKRAESSDGRRADAGRTESPAGKRAGAGRTESPAGKRADAGRTESPAGKRADAGRTESPAGKRTDAGRTKRTGRKGSGRRKQKDPYLHSLKRRCAFLAAMALVLGGILLAKPYLKRYTVPVGGRTITENSSYITDASGLPVQNPLILVNKANPLPEDYEVDLHWLSNGTCAVSSLIYEPLSEMLTDGSSQGLQFVVASGYRDRELQQQLLDEDIEADMQNEGMSWQEAYDKETMETMPPGYSEHSTGLAVDLVALDYQMLDDGQEQTPENHWLQENCSRYGFILRYPKGKEAVTDIHYESWHFRYVGVEAAEEITRRGITLEEYRGAY